MKYRIALGKDPGKVETKTIEWEKIAERLGKHEMSSTKAGTYFVGGAFGSEERKEENLLCRSMLTIDIDKFDGDTEALELALVLGLDCAFVAYSTFSHAPHDPHVRLVVPMSREVTPTEYREASRIFCEALGLPVDRCSFVPNQAMYMPRCKEASAAWAYSQDGEPWIVPDDLGVPVDSGELDDLEDLIASEPLDISDDEVDAYLSAYGPGVLEYDEWLSVGAALHHQFKGDESEGYARWLEWSKRSAKHDDGMMLKKWRSFGKSLRKTTFATVIYKVREAGDMVVDGDTGEVVSSGSAVSVETAAFERLCGDAVGVDSVDAYDSLCARIRRIKESVLPISKRSMLATEIYDAWGKNAGITKSDIKRDIKPAKKMMGVADGEGDDARALQPDWMRPWVYIAATCEFHNTENFQSIKPQAFDMLYSHKSECVARENPIGAVQLAKVECLIDTAADAMFWPGADQFFEYEGKRMVNTYRDTGIVPCETLENDSDAQGVVDDFVGHVKFLIEDEAEQRILIDFMAWVVQHPGDKINWALLLQGAQGVGKSYFGNVMMAVIGDMARNVEPSALGGRFTGWAHGQTLAIIEEIRVSGENRYEIIDRLKPFISNRTIQIEEKGRDHRTVPNFTSYMMFTNHKDALPLDDGDRRYAPIFSRVQDEVQLFRELGGIAKAEAYFDRLFDGLGRRPDALSRFLRDWTISEEFSAKGRAPHTTAREMMINLSVSPEREMIADAIEEYQCGAINDKVVDITWLSELCEGHGETLPKTRALSAILLDMGYMKARRIKIAKRGKYHYFWTRGCSQEWGRKQVAEYHKNGGFEEGDDCPF